MTFILSLSLCHSLTGACSSFLSRDLSHTRAPLSLLLSCCHRLCLSLPVVRAFSLARSLSLSLALFLSHVYTHVYTFNQKIAIPDARHMFHENRHVAAGTKDLPSANMCESPPPRGWCHDKRRGGGGDMELDIMAYNASKRHTPRDTQRNGWLSATHTTPAPHMSQSPLCPPPLHTHTHAPTWL